MKRVVITGIGSVTPLSNTFPDSWESLTKGLSGIAPITKCAPSLSHWCSAGEVKNFNPALYLTFKEIRHFDPFVQYAVAAACMAAADAGILHQKTEDRSQESGFRSQNTDYRKQKAEGQNNTKPGKETTSSRITHHALLQNAGVIIGSSRGGISTLEKAIGKMHTGGRVSPYLMPATTISMAVSFIAQKLGVRGHCLGVSNACASGANAIGEGFRSIRYGQSNIILAGGTEAPLCRLCVEGYGSAGALSKRNGASASRPFDATRDGFVLAEGACVLVLEEYCSALERGAHIYGEIIGYSSTGDAFHITKPDPAGEAYALAAALSDAGVRPEEIDYINAHGTATPLGDRTEAAAIREIFGARTRDIPVSAIKSMTGHMLAASGAFEIASTLMSIKHGIIPPTINLIERDPDCDLKVITEKKEASITHALSSSFGFGGVNAVIVLRKVNR